MAIPKPAVRPSMRALVLLLSILCAPTPIAAQSVNLISNPDFALDVSGWTPANGDGTLLWDSVDVGGSAKSGSGVLFASGPTGIDAGCLAIPGGVTLHISTSFRILGAEPGQGSIAVVSFGGTECGPILDSKVLQGAVTDTDQWTELVTELVTPAGTGSMRIVVQLVPNGSSAVSNIDNVYSRVTPRMTSQRYAMVGGSLSSGARNDLTSTAPAPTVTLSGATLGEVSVGSRSTAPCGVTLEPGFWPIVAAPEPGAIGCAAAAWLALMGLRRRMRR